jgi:hypothetical protein
MNEITLVARLREDVPAGAGLAAAERRLAESIAASAVPAASIQNRPVVRRRGALGWAVAGIAVVAVAVVAVSAVVVGGSNPPSRTPTSSHGIHPKPLVVGLPTNAVQLVAYANQAAAAQPPFNPSPHEWIFTKRLAASSSGGVGGSLQGPPDQRVTQLSWTRVDGRQLAYLAHGKLVVTPRSSGRATPGGWPDVSYRYLNSLPSDPAQLRSVILANLKTQNYVVGSGNLGVFNAIQDLMENIVLPPQLRANLYGVLASLPDAHFDRAVTDIAHRHGVAFATVDAHGVKDEIVINPKTFDYMGDQYLATRSYSSVADDGTVHIHKGQILGWSALVQSAIVHRAGQR